jgi:Diadenosine tetraphosphate (Ap4A) hydrolase and other HIT family hydrolases
VSFCRIVAGEIPSDIVYQDEDLLAFRDIEPQAPKHVVIIPKTHIASLAELTQEQQGLVGRLVMLAQKLAEEEGIARSGYRVAINCGPEGGQVVPHLHLHLIGGRRLSDQLG